MSYEVIALTILVVILAGADTYLAISTNWPHVVSRLVAFFHDLWQTLRTSVGL
jgi:hypothetical protein